MTEREKQHDACESFVANALAVIEHRESNRNALENHVDALCDDLVNIEALCLAASGCQFEMRLRSAFDQVWPEPSE